MSTYPRVRPFSGCPRDPLFLGRISSSGACIESPLTSSFGMDGRRGFRKSPLLLSGGECPCARCSPVASQETGAQEEGHQCGFSRAAVRIVHRHPIHHPGAPGSESQAVPVRRCDGCECPTATCRSSAQAAVSGGWEPRCCQGFCEQDRSCPQNQSFSSPDDPNLPAADLQEAFNAAADPPTLNQAIFQQSQAMNALVAHLVGTQDPLSDLASSSSTSLSTKGAGRREKLQSQLAMRSGDFFLQVCQQALRRIRPLDPLPTAVKDLPKKAIFSKYMEKQGGFAGQKDLALTMWLLCQIGDAMVVQDHKGAQELLALALVTIEQVAQDGGKWDLGIFCRFKKIPPSLSIPRRARRQTQG